MVPDSLMLIPDLQIEKPKRIQLSKKANAFKRLYQLKRHCSKNLLLKSTKNWPLSMKKGHNC
jgi:hypothetical protein